MEILLRVGSHWSVTIALTALALRTSPVAGAD